MKNNTLIRTAKICFASGSLEKSIELFTLAEKTNPENSEIYLSRGAALIASGRYAEAREDFSSAISLDADNERAYYYRGITQIGLGEYHLAIEDLTRSLLRNHQRGIAHLLRGLAYTELGEKDDAALDFNTASAFSGAELQSFKKIFGNSSFPFTNTRALLAKGNAPWKNLLSPQSAERLRNLFN